MRRHTGCRPWHLYYSLWNVPTHAHSNWPCPLPYVPRAALLSPSSSFLSLCPSLSDSLSSPIIPLFQGEAVTFPSIDPPLTVTSVILLRHTFPPTRSHLLCALLHLCASALLESDSFKKKRSEYEDLMEEAKEMTFSLRRQKQNSTGPLRRTLCSMLVCWSQKKKKNCWS